MDKIDYRILECLKKNARMSTSAIGETINMSVSAVSERIRRLENSGVISQYTTILDRNKIGQDIKAFIMLRIENPEFSRSSPSSPSSLSSPRSSRPYHKNAFN